MHAYFQEMNLSVKQQQSSVDELERSAGILAKCAGEADVRNLEDRVKEASESWILVCSQIQERYVQLFFSGNAPGVIIVCVIKHKIY